VVLPSGSFLVQIRSVASCLRKLQVPASLVLSSLKGGAADLGAEGNGATHAGFPWSYAGFRWNTFDGHSRSSRRNYSRKLPMLINRRIFWAFLFALYFPLAIWFKFSYQAPPPPPGARLVVRLQRPFPAFLDGNLAFIATEPSLNHLADSEEASATSPVILYENDTALGPPHAPHVDIFETGRGLFSHWRNSDGFVFSSTDGTNPNTNGRQYRAVIPGDK